MDFTTSKKDFLHAVEACSKIVPKIPTLHVVENVLLEVNKEGTVTVEGTNLETYVKHIFTVEVSDKGQGRCLVNCGLLLKMLKNIEHSLIRVYTTKKHLIIESETGKVKLTHSDDKDWPEMFQPEGSDLQMGVSDFKRAVHTVSPSIGTDATRLPLTGVCLSYNDTVEFASTNAHVISMFEVRSIKGKKFDQVIIPAKALAHASSYIDNDEEFVNMVINKYNISISSDTFVIATRCIDAKYPDYKGVIDQEYDQKVDVDNSRLTKTLKMAEAFDAYAKLVIDADTVTVIGQNEDFGDLTETIAVEEAFPRDMIEIKVNVKYLLSVLGVIPSNVRLWYDSPTKAIHLQPATDDSHSFHLIMPAL